MKRLTMNFAVGLLLAFGLPLVVSGQEKSVEDGTDISLTDKLLVDLSAAYYPMLNSGHASEDGHYLAQNQAELQTYYDLGLSYQYIEADYLRKQLNLPAGQGIIIEAAAKTGEGHKNGFRGGDIVLQVDQEPVDTQYKFVIALTEPRGEQRNVKLRRDGHDIDIIVRLDESDIKVEKRWIIGVYVDEISDITKSQLGIDGGVAITQLTDDGPAHNNGLVVHDIVTHIGGQPVNNPEELREVVGGCDGQELTLDVIRRGKKISVTLQPVETEQDSTLRAVYNWSVVAPQAVDLTETLPRQQRYWLQVMNDQKGQIAYWPEVKLDVTTTEPESVSDRLKNLEASMKRIEEVLKDKLNDDDD